MSRKPDCFICRKHRTGHGAPGGAVYEDDLVFIAHAAIREGGTLPLLGHYLVEPKRHIAGTGDMHDAEAQAAGLQIARTSRALQSVAGAQHVYVFVLGHHVDHLHIHLVPRYPGTPREYWGMRVDEWPEAPRGSEQAIFELNERMRAHLRKERF